VAFAAICKDPPPHNFIVKFSNFYSSNFRCRVDILFTLRGRLQPLDVYLIAGDEPNCRTRRFF
jgi:hypothetical protein